MESHRYGSQCRATTVVSIEVTGEARAAMVAARIIKHSQWVEVTPLPDDLFEITVKKENARLLDESV